MTMTRSFTLMAAIVALGIVTQAIAHGDHAEVATDSRNAGTRSTIEGTIRHVTVDDQVSHAAHEYQLLVTDDGETHLLRGDGAQALQNGARYRVLGMSNGKYFQAESAAPSVRASTKAAVAENPFVIDGTLRLGHVDYIDRPSVYFFAVFAADGRRKQIPGAQLLDALENGMEVSVAGHVDANGVLSAEHIIVLRHAQVGAASDTQLKDLKAASTHSVFVVPVKFPNAQAVYPADPFSVTTLKTAVFGAAPAQSVTQYYKEVSYGQQTLTGVTASTGTTPQWLQAADTPPVDIHNNPTCDINFIQDESTAAALNAGYSSAQLNPSNIYPGSAGANNHVVFVFTQTGFNCGWSGLAYIGYGLAFIKQTSALSVISHELGHTFGLYHAGSLDCGVNPIGGTCTVSEYGDPFDVMGNSSAMHFSAFQKQTLKWISDASVTTHSSGVATYTLNPIETPGGSRYAVRIPAGPNRTYWLEYRQPLGFDSGISAANADGAQVRITRPFETYCSGCDSYSNDTELLDMKPGTTTFADAALATGSRFVDVYYGLAVDVLSRTASALTVRVTSLAKAASPDFDASTDTDLVWRNASTGQTMLWLMNGLTTSTSANVMNDAHWKVVKAADVNGDGKADLIWENATTGQTAIWLMNGLSPTSSAVVMADGRWTVTNVGDFNGDGHADLVWRNSVTGQTAIWLMNGVVPSATAVIMWDPAWTVTNVGDFDGDGKSDLWWHNSSTGQSAVWLMNGMSAKASAIEMWDPAWTVTLIGDFDGDGKSDTLWRNSGTGQTAIWLMNGIASTTSTILNVDATWQAKLVGDFDGDGKADILWRNTAGATQAWLMNGISAASAATLTSNASLSAVRVGDFDGNGKSDILWKDAGTGQSAIWLMNGTSTSGSATVMTDANWGVPPSY